MAPLQQAVAGAVGPLSESYGIPILMGMVPAWVLHWSHGGNTAAALLVVAGLGVSEGLAVRRRRLSGEAGGGPRLVDHGTAMASAMIVTLVGASGGLAAVRFDRQPVMESPHAWAAAVSVGLLAANAALSTGLGGRGAAAPAAPGPSARDLHAQVGAAWLASVAATAALGLGLGASYEALAPGTWTADMAYENVPPLELPGDV